MPDAIRASSGSIRTQPRRCGFRVALLVVPGLLSGASRAAAEPSLLATYSRALHAFDRHDFIALVLTLGLLCFAVSAAILLVRTRSRGATREAALRNEIINLKANIDRTGTLLHSEPQVLVAWAAADDEPEILGDTTLVAPAEAPHRLSLAMPTTANHAARGQA